MRNIKVYMSYRGTRYHGFQRQDNAVGIQNVLERMMGKLLNEQVTINGCSRTDTGVHANEFCFSFLTNSTIPCKNFVRGLNSMLPEDIAIISCEEAPEDFHARFSCLAKEYVYKICISESKNPFMADLALHYPYGLDTELIARAALDFVGTHDFTSFCGTAGLKEDNVRTIEYFKVEKDENLVKLLVKGNGFLYNMIRIMVGTLIYINEGKIPPDGIPQIIAALDRTQAGKTAPPHGLYLNKVFYE